MKTSLLVSFREIIAICCKVLPKHINAHCGQNVQFVNVKRGGTQRRTKELGSGGGGFNNFSGEQRTEKTGI